MNQFHVFKNLKKFLLIALSVAILVCSIPSFSLKSKALSTTATYSAVYFLMTYFATRGYSIVHNSQNTITSLSDWRDKTLTDASDLLYDVSVKLNSFGSDRNHPGLGDEFVKALSMAALTGSLILHASTRSLVDDWINTQTSSGSLTVGTQKSNIHSLAQPSGFTFTYQRADTSLWSASNTFSAPAIPIFYHYSNFYRLYFLPDSLEDFSYNALTDSYDFFKSSGSDLVIASTVYNGITYRCNYMNNARVDNANFSYYTDSNSYSWSEDPILYNYISGAYDSVIVSSGPLTTNQITDTSNIEVLTSSNTISDTGEVESDYTLYLPDDNTLEDLLDSYNNQEISYEDLIKALGLATVATTATAAEKEEVLSTVAVPDSTYDWLTRTRWGTDTISDVTDKFSQSQTKEDEKSETLADRLGWPSGQEPDQEDQDKAGKAMLIATILGFIGDWVWPDPNLDSNGNGESGGTNPDDDNDPDNDPDRTRDVLGGVTIASSLIGNIFSAAGGSSGFGMIFTVGASFVIFSTVIGASHFFGALISSDVPSNQNQVQKDSSDPKQSAKSSARSSISRRRRKGA